MVVCSGLQSGLSELPLCLYMPYSQCSVTQALPPCISVHRLVDKVHIKLGIFLSTFDSEGTQMALLTVCGFYPGATPWRVDDEGITTMQMVDDLCSVDGSEQYAINGVVFTKKFARETLHIFSCLEGAFGSFQLEDIGRALASRPRSLQLRHHVAHELISRGWERTFSELEIEIALIMNRISNKGT